MPQTVQERARDAMRIELADAACDLILEHGFDALTVEEIAKGIGMSRATFFRQLGSKEAVVVASLLGGLRQLSHALRSVGPRPDLSVWQHLRLAMEPAVALGENDPVGMRARIHLVRTQPAIRARFRGDRVPQIEALSEALVGCGHEPFAAQVYAGAAMAALDQCWSVWMDDERRSFRKTVDQAFALLDAGSKLGPPA